MFLRACPRFKLAEHRTALRRDFCVDVLSLARPGSQYLARVRLLPPTPMAVPGKCFVQYTKRGSLRSLVWIIIFTGYGWMVTLFVVRPETAWQLDLTLASLTPSIIITIDRRPILHAPRFS
jgi:hypothetical protein